MRRTLIASLALALVACGTTPEPGIEVRIQRVPVEVLKPCPAEVPVRPGPLGALDPDPVIALAQSLATLAEYSGPGKYADKAEAYFETCPPAEPE